MKKIFLLMAFVSLISVGAFAQTTSASAMTKGTVTAIVNTGSDTATIKSVGSYANASIQVVVTKVSGTPAGTVKLYASLDGTNYVQINTTDSLIITNTAKCSKIFTVTPSKYLYYRTIAVGAGTMNATYVGWFLGKN